MRGELPNAQASVLDRLLDDAPGVTSEPVPLRLQDIGQVKASVIRDLENLLNTKRSAEEPPEEFRQLHDSLMVYGLSDLTSHNARSPGTRQTILREIERIIARFEPRLRNAEVHLEAHGENDRVLRFRITGVLRVEPLAEPVTFDTMLDVNNVQFQVRG
jgi:type VI secretion system protein ImpF